MNTVVVHAPTLGIKVKKIIDRGSPTAAEEFFLKHQMIILMAGDAAVRKFKGHNRYFKGVQSDNHAFVICAEGMGIYDKALTYYSLYILEEAKNLFESDEIWNYVKTLANLLCEKNTVKYSECKKLYMQICWNMPLLKQ